MSIMRFEKGRHLKKMTTLGIGGAAKFFAEVKKEGELPSIFSEAKRRKLEWYVLGSGSNIVAADPGFPGLIVRVNIKKFERSGIKLMVGAGNNLFEFIKKINQLGFSGMERMAGIPGTIAGAIYGNAGAYGQEICDHLVRVRIFDQKKFRWLSKKACQLRYRDSLFKERKDWVIVGAEFKFLKDSPKKLEKISRDIVRLRLKRYPREMSCPGSFFKNILWSNLPKSQKKRIPPDKVVYGKVPAGYLLEEVGAKGLSSGGIRIARHHANLFYNAGGGRAQDIKKLAELLKKKVYRKFGGRLEEEIQYLS